MTNNPVTKKIAVIGGDARMLYCAKKLCEFGFETTVFGFDMAEEIPLGCIKCNDINDALCGSDCIILPMPLTTDNVTLNMPLSDFSLSLPSLFSFVDKKCAVFAGNVSIEVSSLAKKFGIKIIDYFDREELKIANAVLTAESAVEIAMSNTSFSITDYPVLVAGYGRIGKALCRILKAMGCEVFASARKNADKAWISAFGYSSLDTGNIREYIGKCKIVFNTIPNVVFDSDVLSAVSKDALIIDLASKPGGVDFEIAKKEKIKVIWALALPGKKLKISAGKAIADTLLNIFEEEGITK